MRVAIVHDYIKEYGGAERVLEALCEFYPDAPIYTAFVQKNSVAYEKFKHRKIITSWVQNIPFFSTKLHSPLRFLAPFIWNSFDFTGYDVVITSASWYITKGVLKGRKNPSTTLKTKVSTEGKRQIEVCYCHTPPRWLYGYNTSIEWQKFWPIKLYGIVIGHFMRQYDFSAAQKVDYFIANSEETKARINKFYRRDAEVIYPPVELSNLKLKTKNLKQTRDYYFIVSRLVGGKGLDLAIEAANRLGIKLKIAGTPSGYSSVYENMTKTAKDNIEFLGKVTDEALVKLYSNAKAFLALSTDEDFGITPVEAMSCGTPVIAYYGGGYKETVVEGKTGLFFYENSPEGLMDAIKRFEKLQVDERFRPKDCRMQAEKFSKEHFKKEIEKFINSKLRQ